MEITRFDQAKTYDAPMHFGMTGRRLQGLDATAAENFWVGFSTFEPEGGAENSSTPFEKIYVVLEGEVVVTVNEGSFTLKKYDSCRIEPNETRSMVNASDISAEVLVIIPTIHKKGN